VSLLIDNYLIETGKSWLRSCFKCIN